MNIVTLLATVVSQLALIARDPALGARGEALTAALMLLSTLIVRGEAARAEIEALAAQIQAMVADGNRAPALAEYQDLRDRSRQYHRELNPEPEPTLNPSPPAADGDNG